MEYEKLNSYTEENNELWNNDATYAGSARIRYHESYPLFKIIRPHIVILKVVLITVFSILSAHWATYSFTLHH